MSVSLRFSAQRAFLEDISSLVLDVGVGVVGVGVVGLNAVQAWIHRSHNLRGTAIIYVPTASLKALTLT